MGEESVCLCHSVICGPPARVASSGVGPQAEQRASRRAWELLLRGSHPCSAHPGWGRAACSGHGGKGAPCSQCWPPSPPPPGLFPPHTAGCGPLCCSRRGACLSASLLFLLATLAAFIALVTILGLPSRTPGQGGQERVGQTRWEGHGEAQRDEGAPTCLASLPGDFGQIP